MSETTAAISAPTSQHVVFVSYSHEDSDFVELLVEDLQFAGVNTAYDKLILRTGDSLFEKLAPELARAEAIIVVVSPASIRSQWVQAELGLAMASRFNERPLRVLPALISECELPATLSDKAFADFRHSYCGGLRELLNALCPEIRANLNANYQRREQLESDRSGLESVLESGEMDTVRLWFQGHNYVLAGLFGRLWAVSEAIPGFCLPASKENADFVVINGQSFMYEFLVVNLGPPKLIRGELGQLTQSIIHLKQLLVQFEEDQKAFCRAVALRCSNLYGADQLFENLPNGPSLPRRFEIHAKLICERREDFSTLGERLRADTFDASSGRIEIVSYDRVLDVIQKISRG